MGVAPTEPIDFFFFKAQRPGGAWPKACRPAPVGTWRKAASLGTALNGLFFNEVSAQQARVSSQTPLCSQVACASRCCFGLDCAPRWSVYQGAAMPRPRRDPFFFFFLMRANGQVTRGPTTQKRGREKRPTATSFFFFLSFLQ